MSKLSEAEIAGKMPDAKGWERHGDMLVRTWQFPSFRRAMEFVNQAAAERRFSIGTLQRVAQAAKQVVP